LIIIFRLIVVDNLESSVKSLVHVYLRFLDYDKQTHKQTVVNF